MKAYAPGSVTGLYAPSDREDGRSRGVSFATEDGVAVDVTDAPTTRVAVNGVSGSFEPVERLLSEFGVTAAVEVDADAPIGCGFGTSGAATLATALAANATFDLGLDRSTLLGAAHRAEVAAGTGQGDVYIQNVGGLLWSEPDGPRDGYRLDRVGYDGIARIEPEVTVTYASAGGIETSEMLADEEFMAAARRVGTREIDALERPPTVAALADRSRRYARETGIATPFVERTFERVDAAGGHAGMALFGETVFAVGAGDALPERTGIDTGGARLFEG